MRIGGFQKFSLLDYPGQLAAIIFTQGCNFRCPYCHNPELVDPERFEKPLATGRVLDFLRRRRGKLGAVVITGGEPTVQPDLTGFVKKLKFMGFLVKMDTNGSHPDVLQSLVEQKLVDYWAMDIKAPADLYRLVSRSEVPVEDILRSMDILRGSGMEYEFRTTFFERLFDWKDIARVQELLRPGDRFYLQECRYEGTLEDLSSSAADVRKHLQDNPACKTLIRWGDKHQVNIRIRSL
ncbi:MAG TPA: anaerobic ribonucleoside-triphosphate reductase activating protein [Candidatus Syntrophosphaera sp.]|jgi:pyruvate formate lyase activating enzyme|nr:anaerobic ribonucleoside-triphosphate reductase activating protein [Candidatus Cloacimonadota bacterium]OQB91466.1 MAG: molybdenum cofactor biosynthesis protein A [Candidatus Cloacimonetes bacterium ADurb.Bin117]HNU54398.1 anaerobic ribonucleoside-triphosphate reductase activating protein [Candidatus Syntrophosphaera sp.]MDI9524250.1 anaerobic ribonucleoside-triphosphate reductase activating protein [Candidatus Cloacimonadota bacterium]HOG31163.1 anaerobic ribonucleoside-triphosphate reducta